MPNLAFAVVDIEIFVYIKSGRPSVAVPSLPVIEGLIVDPIGKNSVGFACVGLYFTIIILVIFKLQDFVCLD